MVTQIQLGEVTIDVVLKDIKNVHLSVHPPTGRVRISAPSWMSLDTIRVFAISKLGWIRSRQSEFEGQERERAREFVDRESHYVWGKRYLLRVVEGNEPPSVELGHSWLALRVRPGAGEEKKRAVLEEFYRRELRDSMPALLAKWEPLMGVNVRRVFVQRMKTRWGSCNPEARAIRLNTELAKKPRQCLEYLVVHEMAHLLEPTHNTRFVALMDRFLPQWELLRDALNAMPLGHETWRY